MDIVEAFRAALAFAPPDLATGNYAGHEFERREFNGETFKGVVRLRGFVSPPASATHAVRAARNVGCVGSVKNDMRLK